MTKTTFSPPILIDGITIIPPSWMWVMALAVSGDKWAIDETSTTEFTNIVQKYLKEQHNTNIANLIVEYTKQIERLKEELNGYIL